MTENKYQVLTLKDIAQAFKVHPSTVSRALRDDHEISASVKKKIKDYAARMNYIPNSIAQSLRNRNSRSIGVLVSEIANSFYAEAVSGIESVASGHGYNVIIAQTGEKGEREYAALQQMASRNVDGVLLSVSIETKEYSSITDMHRKMPIVCFDRVNHYISTYIM